MNILRLRLFSKKDKASDEDVKKRLKNTLLPGLPIIAAGSISGKLVGDHLKINKKPGDDELRNKIIDHARHKNVGINELEYNLNNAYMIPKNESVKLRKLNLLTGKVTEELIKAGPDKNHILFGKNASPEAIAHEFGHAKGKKLLQNPANRVVGPLGSMLGAVGGGLRDGKKEGETGEKQKGTVYKVSQLGLTTPLISEAEASIRGYNALKKLGASSHQLSHARKNLALAGGTYAASIATLAGGNNVMYRASKHIGKNKLANKDKKKKD